MTHYITNEQAEEYKRLSLLAAEITEKLTAFAVEIVQSQIPDADKIKTLDWVSRADGFNGLAYHLTPQSEWQGGESWKIRHPHISGTFTPKE